MSDNFVRGAADTDFRNEGEKSGSGDIFCKNCDKKTRHESNGSDSNCVKCGYSPIENEAGLIINLNNLDLDMKEHSEAVYEDQIGARTQLDLRGQKKNQNKLTKPQKTQLAHVDEIDEHKRLLGICRLALKEEDDEEEKLKIKMEISEHKKEIKRLEKILTVPSVEVDYHRLARLQARMQTKVEKQIGLNRERFSEILKSFGADDQIESFTRRIWEKTLKLKLQRGRYLVPNVLACLIIALKISSKRYDLDKEIIFSYTPGQRDTPRWLLKKQVWSAEKLIHERVFGKISCRRNKKTGELCPDLPHWLQDSCPRVDWKIPVKDHKEDIELNLRSFAENTKLKFPINPVLSSAIEIFDNEEAKMIASGKYPSTIIASVIYLALLENNVEISYIEFLSGYPTKASEAGVRQLCKAINDGLKLGIQLNF